MIPLYKDSKVWKHSKKLLWIKNIKRILAFLNLISRWTLFIRDIMWDTSTCSLNFFNVKNLKADEFNTYVPWNI